MKYPVAYNYYLVSRFSSLDRTSHDNKIRNSFYNTANAR